MSNYDNHFNSFLRT